MRPAATTHYYQGSATLTINYCDGCEGYNQKLSAPNQFKATFDDVAKLFYINVLFSEVGPVTSAFGGGVVPSDDPYITPFANSRIFLAGQRYMAYSLSTWPLDPVVLRVGDYPWGEIFLNFLDAGIVRTDACAHPASPTSIDSISFFVHHRDLNGTLAGLSYYAPSHFHFHGSLSYLGNDAEVPEPGTLMLLSSSAVFLLKRKRKLA